MPRATVLMLPGTSIVTKVYELASALPLKTAARPKSIAPRRNVFIALIMRPVRCSPKYVMEDTVSNGLPARENRTALSGHGSERRRAAAEPDILTLGTRRMSIRKLVWLGAALA